MLWEDVVIKVGVVGGTGYTGVELLRLLAGHGEVDVSVITSRAETGRRVDDLFPNLRGYYDLEFTAPDTDALAECDVVFYATPHNVAMHTIPDLLQRGVKVIDLSADFRIRDAELWAKWYGEEHACPELLSQAVYGLPEFNREAMKGAQLIACPGCYPTSVQLGLLPLLQADVVDRSSLIANAASGVSGAGRQAKVDNIVSEASDNFKAYAVSGHRHLPEIEQGLSDFSGEPVAITFVPHLLPIIRGIHTTLYAKLTAEVDAQSLFENAYADEPFVDVLPAGQYPQTRSVRGSNYCRISVDQPQGRDMLVIMVAEDNLVKGASGQAIQAMNIICGLDERAGLQTVALLP